MLQDYKEKPDYGRCVAIVASASLREMIKPGALAIVSPIVIGRSYPLLQVISLLCMHACLHMPMPMRFEKSAWLNAMIEDFNNCLILAFDVIEFLKSYFYILVVRLSLDSILKKARDEIGWC